MGKTLVIIGVILIVVGLLWQVGGRFFHFGRLPGDIVVEKENFRFYFPVVTCIIISVVLSLIMYVIRFFK
ncbi:DUF2905 domain-containing protein [Brevibacillus laterosporus]|uniref:DUF2905 domain-containing protein n=1 Tax=Brevibacillus laterosporus TaxID=1465 RepID=A0A502IQI2_BRELA|nr:DUF2905 domain-containing protein [Brevibacillus laterosporus]QDX94271.1 DUF2905 domain-containing protein [Brevibacillus laterosporus]RAP31145.1 hypothetical protein C2W64_00317 [Brevibacillus laterosporus]TPG68208.1 DUF2905 domain-containing protein [Brevibacillus laterosporus]TPG88665.1 DUF2905 domain-containing protein [Brevibacillus laterosporus]